MELSSSRSHKFNKIWIWTIEADQLPVDPIHFMLGSRVGFSGSADRMALFPVTWIISNGHISATAHSIHIYLCDSTAFLSPRVLKLNADW